jgi:hypothetical protein
MAGIAGMADYIGWEREWIASNEQRVSKDGRLIGREFNGIANCGLAAFSKTKD